MPYVVASSIFLLSVVAGAQGVPSNLQAAIFYKVLAYDYNIQKKTGDSITIVVVTDGQSAGKKEALSAGFNKISGQKLGSKTVKIAAITVSGAGELESKIKSAGGDIVYLAEGSSHRVVTKLLQVAQANRLSTLCGSETLTQKGFAIGLMVENGKPKIVINLPASQKQGMKLSSKVLRLAKVIK